MGKARPGLECSVFLEFLIAGQGPSAANLSRLSLLSSLAATSVTGLVRSLAWVFQEHTQTQLIPPSPHREQRLTGLVVFILTGVSIFLAPVLKVHAWLGSGPVQQSQWN